MSIINITKITTYWNNWKDFEIKVSQKSKRLGLEFKSGILIQFWRHSEEFISFYTSKPLFMSRSIRAASLDAITLRTAHAQRRANIATAIASWSTRHGASFAPLLPLKHLVGNASIRAEGKKLYSSPLCSLQGHWPNCCVQRSSGKGQRVLSSKAPRYIRKRPARFPEIKIKIFDII